MASIVCGQNDNSSVSETGTYFFPPFERVRHWNTLSACLEVEDCRMVLGGQGECETRDCCTICMVREG